MPKYLSGRSKRTPNERLPLDRYNYISLGDAEPNPSDPKTLGISEGGTGPVVIGDAIPSGVKYQLISIWDDPNPGRRYWQPVEGGLIPGAITFYEKNAQISGSSSITQMDWYGIGVTFGIQNKGSSSTDIRARIYVAPPGKVGELVFNENSPDYFGTGLARTDFSTSSDLVFNSTVGILTVGSGIHIGNGIVGFGSIFNAIGVGNSAMVGVGTTNPTQNLHLVGNLRLTGTIYDGDNYGGGQGDLLVKASDDTLEWKSPNQVQAGAGGTISNIQYHDDTGLVEGAPNFVWIEPTEGEDGKVGIGSTQPTVLLDVLGDSIFTGITTVGFITATNVWVSSGSTFGGVIDANDGINASTAKIEDLSGDRVVFTSTGGELEVSDKLEYNTTDGLSVTGLITATNLAASGIATIGDVKISSNKVEGISGNLLLEANGEYVQIDDRLYVNDTEESTTVDTGALQVDGGAGINGNLNVGGAVSFTGPSVGVAVTLAAAGGITTTGGDLYIGGDLFVNDDIFLDEARVQSLIVNAGVATFYGNLHVADNIMHKDDIDTKIFFGDNSVTVATAGQNNVGIGTSVITLTSPSGYDTKVRLQHQGNSGYGEITLDRGANAFIIDNDPTNASSDKSYFSIKNKGTENLHITPDGDVGIGTTNPDGRLDVTKDSDTDYSATTDQRSSAQIIARNSTAGTNNFASISLVNGGGTQAEASINLIETDDYLGDITFKSRTGSTSWTERVRIDSLGNVGIGYTRASNFLAGANRLVVGNGNDNQGITIYSGQDVGDYGSIYFADGTSGAALNKGMIRYEQNNEIMSFHTNNTEKLTIDLNGKVGIGSTAPATLLDILGDGANGEITAQRKDGASILTQAQASLGRFGTNSNHDLQLMANNDGKITIKTGGNIGIGTVTPNSLVDIHGANSAAAIRLTESAHTNTNRYTKIFQHGGTTYFQSRNDTNYGGFVFRGETATTTPEYLRITSDGDVGIGTNNPIGTAALTDNEATLAVGVVTATTLYGSVIGGITVTGNITIPDWILHEGNTNTRFGFPDENVFAVQTAGSRRLTISSNGEVGIGTSTPNTPLHVSTSGTDVLTLESTEGGSLGANLIIRHTSPSPGDNDIVGTIQFDGLDDAGTPNSTTYAKIKGIAREVSSGSEYGVLAFETRTDADNFTEKLRIDSNGNVGIGTDIPLSKLTVAADSAAAEIEMKRLNTNTTGAFGAINWTAMDGHSVANMYALGDGDNEGAHLIFKTTSAAAEQNPYGTGTVERVRIASDGKVGINTDKISEYGKQVIINGALGLTGDSNTTNPDSPNDVGMNFFRSQSDTEGYIGIGSYALSHGEPDDFSFVGKGNLLFGNLDGSWKERLRIDSSGYLIPGEDGTQDIGSDSKRWNKIWAKDVDITGEIDLTGDVTIADLYVTGIATFVKESNFNSGTIITGICTIKDSGDGTGGVGEGGPFIFRDGGYGPDIVFHSSTGTLASPTASTDTNYIGNINFAPHDGTEYIRMASINARVTGTVSTGNVPTALIFRTGSTTRTERLRITSGGQISINNTSPKEWDTSYTSLQIHDAGYIAGSTDDSFVAIGANNYLDGTDDEYKYINADFASQLYQVDGTLVFRNVASGIADNAITWAERLRIADDGQLQVKAPNSDSHYSVANTSGTMTVLDTTEPSAAGVGGRIVFGSKYWTGSNTMSGASIGQYKEHAPSNGVDEYQHALTFDTRNENGIGERLRITSDGDVGIGTNNPTSTAALTNNERVLAVGVVTANQFYGPITGALTPTGSLLIEDDLTVNGNTTLGSDNTDTITLNGKVQTGTVFEGAGADTATDPLVRLNNTSSATFNHSLQIMAENLEAGETNLVAIGRSTNKLDSAWIGYRWYAPDDTSNLLTFGHWGGGYNYLMNLDGNGNLGIGTHTPGTKLDVAGSIRSTVRPWYFTTNQYAATFTAREDAGHAFELTVNQNNSTAQEILGTYQTGDVSSTNINAENGWKVGIGTTNPDSLLTLNATINPTISIKTAGTLRSALIADTGNTETVLASYDSYPLVFSVSSGGGYDERLRIDLSGNLLRGGTGQDIGASGSTWNAVYADTFYGSVQGGITATGDITIPEWILHKENTITKFGFPGNNIFAVETNSKRRLTINSNGYVGIATDSPNAPLDVRSSNTSSIGVANTIFKLSDSSFQVYQDHANWTTADYSPMPILRYGYKGGPGDYMYMASGGNTTVANQMAIMVSDNEGFKVGRSGYDGDQGDVSDTAEYFRITKDGDVGIGTNNPKHTAAVGDDNTATLAVGILTARQIYGPVTGDLTSTGDVTINGELEVIKNSSTFYIAGTEIDPILTISNAQTTADNTYAGLRLSSQRDGGKAAVFNIACVSSNVDYASSLVFQSRTGASDWARRFYIRSNGEVGINETPLNGQMLAIKGRTGYDDIVQVTALGSDVGARINLTNTGVGTARINATNNDLELQTLGIGRLRITSDGDVGIGTEVPTTPVLSTNTKKLAVGIVTAHEIYGTFKGTIDGTSTGTAEFAQKAQKIETKTKDDLTTGYLTFVDSNNAGDGDYESLYTASGIKVDSDTDKITATTFVGDLEGDLVSGETTSFPRIVYNSAADTTAFLARGTDGEYLKINSSNQLEWDTPSGTGISEVTVTQYAEGTTARTCSNPIYVTDSYKIGIGSTSNAYGKRYIQTSEPTGDDLCDGDIWYDISGTGTGASSTFNNITIGAGSDGNKVQSINSKDLILESSTGTVTTPSSFISAKIESTLHVENHDASAGGDKLFTAANTSRVYRATGVRSGDEFSIPNNTLEAGASITIFNTTNDIVQIGVEANVTVWLSGSNIAVTSGGSASAILLAPHGLATFLCTVKGATSEFVVSGGGVYTN